MFKTILRLFFGCRGEQQTITKDKECNPASTSALHVTTYVFEGEVMHEMGCPICFEAWMYGALLTETGCGHTFHTVCLNRWFDKRFNCPKCRTDLLELNDPK